jgi:type II secretory ATPase GspE/PulE/Tfp pilus assembly ATPase PilB-like protein
MSQDARLDEEQSTERRARVLGLDYVNTSQITNKALYKEVLSIDQIRKLRSVPIQKDKSHLLFGVTTTTSQQTIAWLKQNFIEQRVSIALISDNGFDEYVKLYDPPPIITYREIELNQADTPTLVSEISGILNQVKADDMLAYLVQQAHRLGASDIHLESKEQGARVRFRIDGVLHAIANINTDKYRMLISAIASAGNISTSAKEAQQGHISQKVTMADKSEVDVNVRIETVQTINAMDVVMRLFNMNESMYNLNLLGLSQSERSVVDDIIAKPSGLVMIVGPTGSGKTTTLYSMLKSLSNDERKIITIEDPVEYQFKDITQISVSTSEESKHSIFADQLRAVLRLDPDIIMVGEIRDMDTAKAALQAAMTGHLVLSTFHANSAAAALTRLADIINQNPLYISAIRLVMAQRLVRSLNPNSREPYTPSEAELKKLDEIISTLPEGRDRPDLNNLQLFKPLVSADNPYGYKGQIAIREQFIMSDLIRSILTAPNQTVTTRDIEQAAINSGMITMIQDAALKVIAGQTTLDEIFRVIG